MTFNYDAKTTAVAQNNGWYSSHFLQSDHQLLARKLMLQAQVYRMRYRIIGRVDSSYSIYIGKRLFECVRAHCLTEFNFHLQETQPTLIVCAFLLTVSQCHIDIYLSS